MQIRAQLPWLLCAVLAMFVLWLAFKLIDQSVTIDHQMQNASMVVKQRDLLAHVLNATGAGTPEIKLRELLRQFASDSTFNKGNSEVVAAQVSFFLQNGSLVRVEAESE